MKAKPIAHATDMNGRVSMNMMTPQSVMPNIRNAEDVKATLDYYGRPDAIASLPKAGGKYGRRFFLTWIVPALKWYCDLYKVEQPGWLKSNAMWDTMTPEERKDFFGTDKLEPKQFEPLTREVANAPGKPKNA